MSYIVEVIPPKEHMKNSYESNCYAMSSDFLFKEQAEEVAKAYRAVGCRVRILKETRTVEVIE